ncbi:hypothetical protein [Kitasatospora sp. NPDC088783]|uniref:hypothetical protein n=1 Tax=Kitasatospora sp. NPDC088783 TaxID=3364077 RepID=UPI0037F36CC6
MSDRQIDFEGLVATASREQLEEALLAVLDITGPAQRAAERDDYGIGGWRSSDVVDAEVQARTNVAHDVEAALVQHLR